MWSNIFKGCGARKWRGCLFVFSPHAVRMQRRSCHLKRERLSRGCTRCGEDTPVLAKRSAGVDFELFVVWMLKDLCWSCAVFLRGVCGTVSEVAKSDGWRGGIWTLTVGETGRCQPQAQPRKAAALIVPQYYSFRSFVCHPPAISFSKIEPVIFPRGSILQRPQVLSLLPSFELLVTHAVHAQRQCRRSPTRRAVCPGGVDNHEQEGLL